MSQPLTAPSAPGDWARTKNGRVLPVLALVFLGLFGLLLGHVIYIGNFSWDIPLLQAAHELASPALDAWMLFFTQRGSARELTCVGLILLLLLAWRRRLDQALFLAVVLLGMGELVFVIKRSVRRVRPHLWDSVAPEHTFSFPSAHAMMSCGLFLALLFLSAKRWKPLVALVGGALVVLDGVTRVYLGVHYPSDILGAWTVAAAWVIIARSLQTGVWPGIGGATIKQLLLRYGLLLLVPLLIYLVQAGRPPQ